MNQDFTEEKATFVSKKIHAEGFTWKKNPAQAESKKKIVQDENSPLSTANTLTCGVPQGNILGSLSFFMYINDIPNSPRVAAPRMSTDYTNITLSAKTVADIKLVVTS